MAAPGEAGIVLAQTPNANAVGVDRPRVSVLLSEPLEDSADPEDGYVMPSLVGLNLSSAYARAGAAGLRIVSAEDVTPAAPASVAAPATTTASSPAAAAPATASAAAAPVAAGLGPGIVAAQSPPAGHRVSKGDAVRLSLVH